jgi:anti-sigma B factor antagonist
MKQVREQGDRIAMMNQSTMEPLIRNRPVTVLQLPEQLTAKAQRDFVRELECSMDASRPYVVIDCSNVAQLDRSIVHVMLRSLEEAMKRNGDVKLAGISSDVDLMGRFAAVNRLFEIFDSTEDAVESFCKLSFDAASETGESESAA